jgi:hypothetical protein
MMKFSPFLLPTLAVALDSDGFFQHRLMHDDLERQLEEIPCESELFGEIYECEAANPDACTGESTYWCFDFTGSKYWYNRRYRITLAVLSLSDTLMIC